MNTRLKGQTIVATLVNTRRRGAVLGSLVAGVALVALSGCGSAGSSGAATGAHVSASGTSASTNKCGELPVALPPDPDGVLAKLPAKVRAGYSFYNSPVHSYTTQVKATKPPWTIGFSMLPIADAWQATLKAEYEKLFAQAKAAGLVKGSLIEAVQPDLATATPAAEIAGMQRLVSDHVNGILLQPFSGTSVAPSITAAGKAGIPVVTTAASIPQSLNSINVNVPDYAGATAAVLRGLPGGKGNVLIVRGVESAPTDQEYAGDDKALLANCPNVKVVGTVVGNWSEPAAKTAVQQFLASHPGTINAVIQHSVMAAGIISAFQQSGRPVPPVPLITAAAGEVGYWARNASKGYKTTGTLVAGASYAKLGWNVMMRELGGKKVKVADIAGPAPLITAAQLPAFEQYPLSDTGEPSGSPDILTNAYLNKFFETPGAVTGPKEVVGG
jgi:ribose transport system substrate-binding protein